MEASIHHTLLSYRGGRSDKFYEVACVVLPKDTLVYRRWGRDNARHHGGQFKVERVTSKSKFYDLIEEKKSKGYGIVSENQKSGSWESLTMEDMCVAPPMHLKVASALKEWVDVADQARAQVAIEKMAEDRAAARVEEMEDWGAW